MSWRLRYRLVATSLTLSSWLFIKKSAASFGYIRAIYHLLVEQGIMNKLRSIWIPYSIIPKTNSQPRGSLINPKFQPYFGDAWASIALLKAISSAQTRGTKWSLGWHQLLGFIYFSYSALSVVLWYSVHVLKVLVLTKTKAQQYNSQYQKNRRKKNQKLSPW